MPRINIVKFREDVQAAKDDLGISQKQLAKEAGVSHPVVGKLLTGQLTRTSRRSLENLCSALGLNSGDYYFTDEKETENDDLRATLPDCDPGEDEVDDRPIEEQLEDLKEQNATLSRHLALEGTDRDAAERKLVDAETEITDLKRALDVKNDALSRFSGQIGELTVKLRDDDRLILELLSFVQRLRDGDVEK